MAGAMLSKSLIHISFDQWGCVSSLIFDLRQTMVEVMKIISFGRKAITNPESILKSNNSTFPKVIKESNHLIKAMVFPVVIH